MTVRFAPSILSCDFGHLEREIRAAEAAGADWIHVDVMDGRFVPNLTMGPLIVQAARRATRLPLDVHLMILEPDHLLEAFVKAGADRLSVHVEAAPHLQRTLGRIRELGALPGVALNPHTPIENLRWVLGEIDAVVVMTVNPGYGGQLFLSSMLPKIEAVAQWRRGAERAFEIVADGGVDPGNAASVVRAGATVLVAGNAAFGHPQGVGAGLAALRGAIAGRA
jgi:ribulose-phosphate 3-epimerase